MPVRPLGQPGVFLLKVNHHLHVRSRACCCGCRAARAIYIAYIAIYTLKRNALRAAMLNTRHDLKNAGLAIASRVY